MVVTCLDQLNGTWLATRRGRERFELRHLCQLSDALQTCRFKDHYGVAGPAGPLHRSTIHPRDENGFYDAVRSDKLF